MVKVVAEDPNATKRVTCKHCASVLEYTLSEVIAEPVHDYTGDIELHHYIQCPKCGYEITVKNH